MTLKAAIIGSGPSGFYACAQLLATDEPGFSVDLFDRLPTPFGLVRAGVAPDHPKIKSVTRAFEKTAAHERFRYFGQVELGSDVSRRELLDRYDVVLYAVGTSTDRRLSIPGEDLPGSHPATEFVAWYNGHPDHTGLEVDLGARSAVVVGAGNVAIDVARMLALAPDELRSTDVADHALDVLTRSGIEEITILARRGPLQAAFTNPELLELGDLQRADLDIVAGTVLDPASHAALADTDKTRRRNVEIVQEYAAREPQGRPVVLRLRFLASPVELLAGPDGHLRGVRVERNEIVERAGRLAAVGTGETDELEAQLVFRSVGYTGVPLPDVPFDTDRGVIANRDGRVVDAVGELQRGEYVTGWIKRGPSGVIGTNKRDSQDTVERILEDARAGAIGRPTTAEDIETLLDARGVAYCDWAAWRAIDELETQAGQPEGRPRIKLAEWAALRDAVAARRPTGASARR